MAAWRWFEKGVEGKHVLLALCGFFGIMFLVNGIFVYFAVATHSGGDTSKPYQKGLDYNQTIEADRLQAELSWRVELAYEAAADQVVVKLSDRAGAAVTGHILTGRLTRPVTDRDDRRLRFEEAAPGVYAAHADIPPGRWVVSIISREAGAGGKAAYRLKQRLFVAEKP